MQKVAKFHKVSLEQFKQDWIGAGLDAQNILEIYEHIKLPKRATAGSAGYDFFSPIKLEIPPKTELLLPTGIRAQMQNGTFLAIFPRSGLGFKFKMQLNNTVGIIDADYFNAENEGHIMLKIFNDSNKQQTITIENSSGVAQGIFLPFGITTDDESMGTRTGGFGSTTNK